MAVVTSTLPPAGDRELYLAPGAGSPASSGTATAGADRYGGVGERGDPGACRDSIGRGHARRR